MLSGSTEKRGVAQDTQTAQMPSTESKKDGAQPKTKLAQLKWVRKGI